MTESCVTGVDEDGSCPSPPPTDSFSDDYGYSCSLSLAETTAATTSETTEQQQKHVKLKHSDITLKQSFPRWGVLIIWG